MHQGEKFGINLPWAEGRLGLALELGLMLGPQ